MGASASTIPELEDVIQTGSQQRRAEALRRITALFLNGASRFNEDHVRLFDDVLGRLMTGLEAKARTELANSLAPIANAPVEVVRRLAKDDDIKVARPVLRQSRCLVEADLLDIAGTKSQAHLVAISGRAGIAEPVTDVLIRRGDREVVRRVAENREARLSEDSFARLAERAEQDRVLAQVIGLRPDIPPQLLRELLLTTTEMVRQRLLAAAGTERQAEIRRVLAKVSTEVGAGAAPRDYSAAERSIEALRQAGQLHEPALVDFAKTGKYEETIAALASLCAVPIEVVDRLMGGDRPDPILILGKSAGWEWPTVKAVIMARTGGRRTSSQELDSAFSNFERLSPATAQRVMRFWQVRRPGDRLR